MYLQLDSCFRPKEAARFLGVGVSTFWRWVSLGWLPRGVRLSARATVWRRSDLERFLEQRAAERPAK